MPCDSIVTQQVIFENAKGHEELLVKALQDQGYTVVQQGETIQFRKGYTISGTYQAGKFDAQCSYGDRFDVDAVKRSFSRRAVEHAADKYGFSVKVTGNNKLQLRKKVF